MSPETHSKQTQGKHANDPDQLEERIDETRHEMDETIDAISERLSVNRATQKARDMLRRSAPTPPDGGRAFYQRRPMLLAGGILAAGLGVGFFMSPPATQSRRTGPPLKQRAKVAMKGAKDTAKGKVVHATHEAQVRARDVKHRVQDKVQETREEGRSGIERSRAVAKAAVASTAENVKDVARTTKEETSRSAHEIKAEAKDAKSDVKRDVREAQHRQGVA